MKRIAAKIKKQLEPLVGFFKKSIRSIAVILGAFVVTMTFLFALAFSLFFYWVSDNSVKHLSTSSSKALEYVMNLYSENAFDLNNTTIQYSKDKKFLLSTKITVSKKSSKEETVKIDSLDIEFDLKETIHNKSIPTTIQIKDSSIILDRLNSTPLQEINTHTYQEKNLFNSIKKYSKIFSDKRFLFIENISVNNLKVYHRNKVYNIQNKTTTESGFLSFLTKIKSDGKDSHIKTRIENNDKVVRIHTEAISVPFTILSSMLPYDAFLSSPSLHELSIDGAFQYSFNKKHPRNSIELSLKDHSNENLLKINANNHNEENRLELKDMYILSGDSTIKAKGYADISNGFKLAKINLAAKRLNFEQLLSYWPKSSISKTRKWIKESLSDGDFDAQINFDSGNISSKKALAEITFRDISLKYTNDFSPLTHLNGGLKVYNTKIDIDVESGNMLASRISNSSANINFTKEHTPLEIKINSRGLAKNYIQFLGQKKITQLKEKKFEAENFLGTVDSNIKILIPLSSDDIYKDTKISADAKIKNTGTSILGNLKVKDGEFDLTLDDKKLKIIGCADVNSYDCKVELIGNLEENEDIQTRINIKTSIKDAQKFAEHFNQRIQITEGEAPVDITYISSESKEEIIAAIDIDEAKLSLPDIGLVKKRGDKTHLELDIVRSKDSNWKTESFLLTSPKIDAKSYMEVSSGFDKILNMETDMNYHGNSFKIKYLLEGEKRIVKLHGSEIDLRHSNILDLANISKYSPEQNSYFSVQADKLIMKNDITFHDIVGNFECKSHHCSNSGFSMKINAEDSLNLTLDPEDNKRWSFNTNNAAGFLKGLGIYNDIEGGALEGEMHFVNNPEQENSQILVGELSMKEFKAVKTPTIAKLFLLSPFSAIKKSFATSPLIPFEKMKASFLYTNDKLHLNRSYAIGNTMSVTIEGSIDNKQNSIDLHGKIIPKSKFNSFLASFKGRKASEEEKQGALGNNFMIKGNIGEPSVKINPLSAIVSFIIRLNPLWLI